MKKIFAIATLLSLTVASFAQSNAYWYGKPSKKAQLTQYAITENESYMFPTYDAQEKNYDNDTITVTVTQYETAVDIDSISATSWVLLSPSSAVLAGAKLFLHLVTTGDNQVVYVKQGSTVLDTLNVGSIADVVYYHNGSNFTRVQSTTWPYFKADVTQGTNISTAVTANGDAGVITTVSSNLAIDSSASFTVNNSFVKAGSVILLTTEYTGNGSPVPSVYSATAGSFVLKFKNLGNAALTGAVKFHYLVLNR